MEYCCAETCEENYEWFDPGHTRGKGLCDKCAPANKSRLVEASEMIFPTERAHWAREPDGRLKFVCELCMANEGPMIPMPNGFVCDCCLIDRQDFCMTCCKLWEADSTEPSACVANGRCAVLKSVSVKVLLLVVRNLVRARIHEYKRMMSALFSMDCPRPKNTPQMRRQLEAPLVLILGDHGRETKIKDIQSVESYYENLQNGDLQSDYPDAAPGKRSGRELYAELESQEPFHASELPPPQDAVLKEMGLELFDWETTLAHLEQLEGRAPSVRNPEFMQRISTLLVRVSAARSWLTEPMVFIVPGGAVSGRQMCSGRRVAVRIGALPPFFGLPHLERTTKRVKIDPGLPFVISPTRLLVQHQSTCSLYSVSHAESITKILTLANTPERFAVARTVVYCEETSQFVRITAIACVDRKVGTLYIYRSDSRPLKTITYKNVGSRLYVRACASGMFLVQIRHIVRKETTYTSWIVDAAKGESLLYESGNASSICGLEEWYPYVDALYVKSDENPPRMRAHTIRGSHTDMHPVRILPNMHLSPGCSEFCQLKSWTLSLPNPVERLGVPIPVMGSASPKHAQPFDYWDSTVATVTQEPSPELIWHGALASL